MRLDVPRDAGHVLDVELAEKASGGSYEDYVEKKLFEPLGMKRSMYCNSAENVERRAHGYQVQNGVIRRAPMNVHTNGIDAGFLEAMELPVLAGRSFTLRDDARAAALPPRPDLRQPAAS